jgi:hypothetical protein
MTFSKYLMAREVHGLVQLLVLFLLLAFVVDATEAHQLAVSPSQPTNEQTITIGVTGNWPDGGGPAIKQWTRIGHLIRIDATGILPGIPRPIVPYQLYIEIGHLLPGQYQADYYIEVFAAPVLPPDMRAPPPLPDASISFEVLAAPEPIPALSSRTLALLSFLLLLVPLVVSGEKYRTSRKDNQRLGTL